MPKKQVKLEIIEEKYGKKKIEEAFKEALKPYFEQKKNLPIS